MAMTTFLGWHCYSLFSRIFKQYTKFVSKNNRKFYVNEKYCITTPFEWREDAASENFQCESVLKFSFGGCKSDCCKFIFMCLAVAKVIWIGEDDVCGNFGVRTLASKWCFELVVAKVSALNLCFCICPLVKPSEWRRCCLWKVWYKNFSVKFPCHSKSFVMISCWQLQKWMYKLLQIFVCVLKHKVVGSACQFTIQLICINF